jgi:parvulin-like peptidyl-prolyl isomerase
MNSDDYASTKWKVSHLFIPIEEGQSNAEEIADQRLRQIVAQLESTSESMREKRFAELAVAESDGATAKQGGMIGWVSKSGDLPDSVMKTIRATSVGTVTAAVRSPLGFHLAFVHEKSSMEVPFEKITDFSRLRRDAANKLFETLVARQSDPKVVWYITALRPPKK